MSSGGVSHDASDEPIAAREGVPSAVPDAPQATPDAATMPTLEERLGTRWAVWVGGLALALGGVLLVRYSIEQGVFGPGVRVSLGAAVCRSSWLRRANGSAARSGRSPIEAVPAAHIPSILTAAGTASAFGTVYAAHALYEFIGPGAAFVALGAIAHCHHVCRRAAWAGSRRSRPRRRFRCADAGRVRGAQPVAAGDLSGGRGCGSLRAGALAPLALARGGSCCRRRRLGVRTAGAGRCRPLGILGACAVRARGHAAGARCRVHGGRAASGCRRRCRRARLDRDRRARGPHRSRRPRARRRAHGYAMAAVRHRRDGDPRGHRLAQRACRGRRSALAGVVALAAIALWPGLKDAAGAAPARAGRRAMCCGCRRTSPASCSSPRSSTLAIAALATLRLWRGRPLPLRTAGLYALAAVVPPLLALVLAYLRVTQFDRSISFALFAVALAGAFYFVADRFDKIAPPTRRPPPISPSAPSPPAWPPP